VWPEIAFKIVDEFHTTLAIAHSDARSRRTELTGSGVVRCAFESLPLVPKTYRVWGQVLRLPDYLEEVPWQPMGAFAVGGPRWEPPDAHMVHKWDVPLLNIPTQWMLDGPGSFAAHHVKSDDP
jgi:hypothetical protein